MNRSITAVAALLVALSFASTARAEMMAGQHKSGSVGFHDVSAPIGTRWWFSGQKVGLDLGFGYDANPAPNHSDEKVNSWRVDVGVPFVMHSWDRCHVILRPGFLYGSNQVETSAAPPAAFETDDATGWRLSGELEAEVFLVENVSVSASTGIAYDSFDPVGPGDSITSFTTFGNNFTNIGFHVYFLGN